MSNNISHTGTIATIICESIFGKTIKPISNFADDQDSISISSKAIAETAMNTNKTMVYWSKSAPIVASISLIPNSTGDITLEAIAKYGDSSQPAIITLIVTNPNGTIQTLTGGIITEYTPGNSHASSGRINSKTYTFNFEKHEIATAPSGL